MKKDVQITDLIGEFAYVILRVPNSTAFMKAGEIREQVRVENMQSNSEVDKHWCRNIFWSKWTACVN